ncbi:peptidylprolyl isomerase fpr4 [Xylographa soralifera]|nr:peptidylprolyl isomerase fpr4 [Xylographa soralifera]
MSGLLPAAVFGLEVPAGDVMIPAVPDFPASFRITMAAIDPSAEPEYTGTANGETPIRATLKLIRQPIGPDDEDSEEGSEDEDYLNALLNGKVSDEEEESSEEEEKNGGPSDPSKTKKARKEAAVEQLKAALAEDDSDDEMGIEGTNGINGFVSKLNKGKAKATNDGDDEDLDDDDSEDIETEEFVICTLDPTKNYQQPLDITIGEDERVFFKVSGTHAIFLTGNYVIPVDDGHRHDTEEEDYDEEDYDLSPDEDELDDVEGSDELDALDDPRLVEIDSEEDAEPPKLVKTEKASKKGKNKRAAADSDDEPAGLDDIMAKSLKPEEPITNGDVKLSKKQLKKLKKNSGEAVVTAIENKSAKKVEPPSVESPNSKKVQFAKNLEQGPSGAATNGKTKVTAVTEQAKEEKKDSDKGKASLGVKTVQGVKIDDKKLGTGPAAKKGNRVGMRYIGKLQDGKVFDANKKGKPFSFKLGGGEVIKGWDIGVAGMSVGGERRITVPAGLAYGSKAMPDIPANSTLVFDLKLLEIN